MNNSTPGSPLYVAAGISLCLLSASAIAADISITIKDRKQKAVHDTVIELVGADANGLTEKQIEITQHKEEFDPVLSLIPQGASVLFTNQDPFQHHVYSVSSGNEFDLPLFRDDPARPVQFNTPGVVKMGCNIHDWMLAFGYVSETTRVVLTDTRGRAYFKHLPGGEYQLRVWNPRMKNNSKPIVQSLSVQPDQSLEHVVEVSLRKKIRKPRRKQDNGAYSLDSYQGHN